MDSELKQTTKSGEPLTASGATANPRLRCRRCRLPVANDEREVYFLRAGLCFWCAHVESQG